MLILAVFLIPICIEVLLLRVVVGIIIFGVPYWILTGKDPCELVENSYMADIADRLIDKI